MTNQSTMAVCSECRGLFPCSALNHWQLCESCCEVLQLDADLRFALGVKRDGLTPDEKAQEVEFARKQAEKVRGAWFSLPETE